MEDIEEIRRRKMREMQKMLKEKKLADERKQKERQEVERILSQVIQPDGLAYLKEVRASSPEVAAKIEETIIALVVQRRIRYKIDRIIVKAIERKIRGLEPTISFVRKGKRMEISEKLKQGE